MKFGVVQFPGSNCDDDALFVVQDMLADLGGQGQMLWHKENSLGDVGCVIVPGGFSYGDYLRAGAMAAHSPIMAEVKRFSEQGGPVLGICNGFQILCEAGLLPGALLRNDSGKFICKDVHCLVESGNTPFTRKKKSEVLLMSIAHAEGRYMHSDVASLEKNGQVVFRYSSASGEVASSDNPNGSVGNIAGVCNSSGNVVGLMPHPERACENVLGNGGSDGLRLFHSALGTIS